MYIRLGLFLALIAQQASSFVPNAIHHNQYRSTSTNSKTARALGVDPAFINDFSNSLSDAFTSMSLSDAVDVLASPDAVGDAVAAVGDSLTNAVPVDVAGDAVDVVVKDNGWFGFLVTPISGLIQLIHGLLTGMGMTENAWGISIIFLTVFIKLVTFPLTKTQLESTNKMQALQPQIKELQEKYASNPEVMNQRVSEVYQSNEVNPLAGCVPSLVQIPVFIGLYRAVLNLAQDDKLNEPFLWLPNLEGPTYGADPSSGSDWIFKNWVDGVPSLGWDDTIAFLILPVVLVISQFVSMELMQPKDPAAKQNNAVLKVLPLMIGWFSLNVPAALCIYWVINNLVTTTTTLLIRNSMDPVAAAPAAASTSSAPAQQAIFAPPPMKEKPEGFGAQTFSDEVKPLTSIVEAEVVEAVVEDDTVGSETGDAPKPKRKKGKKRGKKGKKN